MPAEKPSTYEQADESLIGHDWLFHAYILLSRVFSSLSLFLLLFSADSLQKWRFWDPVEGLGSYEPILFES